MALTSGQADGQCKIETIPLVLDWVRIGLRTSRWLLVTKGQRWCEGCDINLGRTMRLECRMESVPYQCRGKWYNNLEQSSYQEDQCKWSHLALDTHLRVHWLEI